MNREEIRQHLRQNHADFINEVSGLPERAFLYAPSEKWTPGQHLDHIVKSTHPLAKGMLLPKFVLRKMFGVTNRPSKSYDGLIEKYLNKISEGGKASGKFIPNPVLFSQKEKLVRQLNRIVSKIDTRLAKFSEEELDTLIVPHPLLGKLTLREMMYFTLYHVLHHQKIVIRDRMAG